ncbi:hypothetical protein EXE59_08340 [Nocardioides eburneiflavus]|uniref:Alpha/beta fold hydrolase n=1 Tax=Nocardioides eburneiflavus TaxID=2518372 RepID=A0A4Z1CJX2_9ACTN|nr:hypothetical protein [Nocardioides eburneiflavus]TGN63960.1 hypothetical protein EXE59_08340 [Nocardioides eburneiflavus]
MIGRTRDGEPAGGRSTLAARAYAAATAAEAWAYGLLERLGVDAAHVAGNSMGGFVAATSCSSATGATRSCSTASPTSTASRPSTTG